MGWWAKLSPPAGPTKRVEEAPIAGVALYDGMLRQVTDTRDVERFTMRMLRERDEVEIEVDVMFEEEV